MPLLRDESEKRIAAKRLPKAKDKDRQATNLSVQYLFVVSRSGAVDESFLFFWARRCRVGNSHRSLCDE
jgi:hypothetical protein